MAEAVTTTKKRRGKRTANKAAASAAASAAAPAAVPAAAPVATVAPVPIAPIVPVPKPSKKAESPMAIVIHGLFEPLDSYNGNKAFRATPEDVGLGDIAVDAANSAERCDVESMLGSFATLLEVTDQLTSNVDKKRKAVGLSYNDFVNLVIGISDAQTQFVNILIATLKTNCGLVPK